MIYLLVLDDGTAFITEQVPNASELGNWHDGLLDIFKIDSDPSVSKLIRYDGKMPKPEEETVEEKFIWQQVEEVPS